MGCGTSAPAVVEPPTNAQAAPGFEALGSFLLTKQGPKSAAEVLAGKTAVGIYFSAHWCPPCRGFTPELVKMYRDCFQAKGMEIVFVSSDKNQNAFNSYFSGMPWTALPFAASEKDSLSQKFKVGGIPTLVILGPDGQTITTEGREAVSLDPVGEKYPWHPLTREQKAERVLDLVGSDLLSKTEGKHFALYFSAHWCPPCRGFTPQLAQHYEAGLKERLSIIFVSSDRSEGEFNEYRAEMPWLALPYDKRKEAGELNRLCGVNGIPSLCVFDKNGVLITAEGRKHVSRDPKGEGFPETWQPQPLGDAEDAAQLLGSTQSLLLLNGDSAAESAMKEVALEYHKAAGGEVDQMSPRFFLSPTDVPLTAKLEALMQLSGMQLVLIDIPAGGAFYQCESFQPDASCVRSFLQEFREQKVTKKQLKKP